MAKHAYPKEQRKHSGCYVWRRLKAKAPSKDLFKNSNLKAFLVCLFIAAVLVYCLLKWFASFSAGAASTSQSFRLIKPSEQIYVLVDKPSLPIDLEVAFDEGTAHQKREIRLNLSGSEDLTHDEVAYKIFIRGPAFEENSPFKSDQQGDCFFRFQVVPATGVTCAHRIVPEGGLASKAAGNWQVISGTMTRNSQGAIFATAYIEPAGLSWSMAQGKRTVFAFPEVGTVERISVIPEEYPRVVTTEGERLFPPLLRTMIDYRDLEMNEEVRTSYPSMHSPDRLLWVNDAGGSTQARGVIDDIFAGENQAVAYVFFGTTVGLFPAALIGIYRLLAKFFAQKHKNRSTAS